MKVQKRIRNIVQNIVLLLIVCSLLLIVLEFFLRIYKPFEFRIKGEKIILPINEKYVFKNEKTNKLDSNIIHTKNSLGFRGEDPPWDFGNHLTLITVGGSTTECFYISDGKTWIDVLGDKLKGNFNNTWINNAGLDGQSTFGHIVLMEDHIKQLRPKVALFLLLGSNDREENATYNKFDKKMMNQEYDANTVKAAILRLSYHSEVFGTMLNMYRYVKARNMGLGHKILDYKTLDYLDIPQATLKERIREINNTKYNLFKKRLEKLIQLSRKNGIDPVFITQPTLFGNAIDDITNVNLAKVRKNKKWNTNGELVWETLEQVNNVIRKVGRENNVLVIDLSKELSKSSKYYYDFIHFSNEGNQKVAQIIYSKLCPYLSDTHNNYLTNICSTLN